MSFELVTAMAYFLCLCSLWHPEEEEEGRKVLVEHNLCFCVLFCEYISVSNIFFKKNQHLEHSNIVILIGWEWGGRV